MNRPILAKLAGCLGWLSPLAKACVVAGLLIRLGLLAWLVSNGYDPAPQKGDMIGYDRIARSILAGRGFSRDGHSPESLRTLGYPYFVAACYGASGGWRYAPLLVQCLLSTAMVVGIAAVLRSWGVGQAGQSAGALVWALHPTLIRLSALLLPDTLFLGCVLLSLWLYGLWLRGPERRPALGAGLAMGLAGLVKPAALLLMPGMALAMLLRKPRGSGSALALLALGFLASLSPNLIRNRIQFGAWELSSITGYNLFYYNAALAEARATGRSLHEVQAAYEEDQARQAGHLTPFQLSRWQTRRALAVMSHEPLHAARAWLSGAVQALVVPSRATWAIVLYGDWPRLDRGISAALSRQSEEAAPTGERGESSGWTRLQRLLAVPAALPAVTEFAFLGLLTIVGIGGLWRASRGGDHAALARGLIVVAALFIAFVGPVGSSRYGLPALPVLSLGVGLLTARAAEQGEARAEGCTTAAG
ncbi:MAG: ArnT family glycosyltransferase [Armatimonadota bacterium]